MTTNGRAIVAAWLVATVGGCTSEETADDGDGWSPTALCGPQIGDVTAPDGGAYGGDAIIESLTVAFDADDEWTFSMDCVLSGAQTYTAEA